MTEFAIGIDGGGTSCRAAVADRTGRIIGRGKAGAANILSDLDTSLANIAASARKAFRDAGLDPAGVEGAAAAVGVAGANVGDYGSRIQQALPFAHSRILTDALISLQGALGDADGVVGAFGTGSVYSARRGGVITEIGGWGFVVGDQASGARLGRDLMERTLLAHDRVHPASPVTDKILLEFGNNPERIVEFAHRSKPKDFARFAPEVVTHADLRDPVAMDIMRVAVHAIEENLDTLLWPECPTICLLGGLAAAYRPWLNPTYRNVLAEPKGDALEGAVAFALHMARNGERPDA